jgi:hypothetical protein
MTKKLPFVYICCLLVMVYLSEVEKCCPQEVGVTLL